MKQLANIAQTPIPRVVVLLGLLLPFVAAAAAFARFVTQSADNRYTLADSLHVYQERMALQHQRDSLIIDAKFGALETPVNALYRACQRKRECP